MIKSQVDRGYVVGRSAVSWRWSRPTQGPWQVIELEITKGLRCGEWEVERAALGTGCE